MMSEVVHHPWTGNVRELRSFAERAIAVGPDVAWAMTRGAEVPSRLPPPPRAPQATDRTWSESLPPIPTDAPFKTLREQWVDHFEREYIRGLVSKLGRDTGAIASAAELDRSYVQRLLRKHDL
jgi:DNA-binding NtrC family response regulator